MSDEYLNPFAISPQDSQEQAQQSDFSEVLENSSELATADLLKTPSQIGRYKIRSELGKGGMGRVYEAYDTELRRVVALKTLLKSHHNKRFVKETKTLAKLSHPSIVKIFDIGYEDDTYFFTMELIVGQELKAYILKEKRRSIRRCVQVMIKVAQAIEYAHQNGIIHRDLKPSNILLDEEQQPHIMDFGLARQVEDQSQLSQSGMLIGTPQYMSPEQATGNTKLVDSSSDVYALGVILYELLTGKCPFEGNNIHAILHNILNKNLLPPTSVNKRVPRDLEAICLKALEKEKSVRYTTAAEFAQELQNFMDGKSIQARPRTVFFDAWKWIQRHKIMASTAFLVTLILIMMTSLMIYQRYRSSVSKEYWQMSNHAQKVVRDYQTTVRLMEVSLQKAQVEMEMSQVWQERREYNKAKLTLEKARNDLLSVKEITESVTAMSRDVTFTLEQLQSFQKRYPYVANEMSYSFADLNEVPSKIAKIKARTTNLHSDCQILQKYSIDPQLYRVSKYSLPTRLMAVSSNVSWKYNIALANPRRIIVMDKNGGTITIIEHSAKVVYAATSKNDRFCASIDIKGNIKLWDSIKNTITTTMYRSQNLPVSAFVFDHRNRFLFVADQKNSAIFDVPSLTMYGSFNDGNENSYGSQFRPDGKEIAICTKKKIAIWDCKNKSKKRHIVVQNCRAVCFSPDSNKLAYAIGSTIYIKSTHKTTHIKHNMNIAALCWSYDGRFIAAAGENGYILVWDAQSLRVVLKLPFVVEEDTRLQLAFHPQKYLLALQQNRSRTYYALQPGLIKKLPFTVVQQNLSRMRVVYETMESLKNNDDFEQHACFRLLFGPKRRFVGCYIFNVVVLWGVASGEHGVLPLKKMTWEQNELRHFSFSSDGDFLLCQTKNYIYVWDTHTRKEVFSENTQRPCLGFHPKHNWILLVNDVKNAIDGYEINSSKKIKRKSFTFSQGVSLHRHSAIVSGEFVVNVAKQLSIHRLTPTLPEIAHAGKLPLQTAQIVGDHLAVGTKSGRLWLFDWQKNTSESIYLSHPIEKVLYDGKQKLYWAITNKNIFVVRPSYQKESSVYPIKIFNGHSFFAKDISRDFSQMVVLTHALDILLLQF
ncbi:WD40 repeat domain-containing serine/threonine protein kinase [Candidatus Uabimicrobium amorphum]|uniref:non-specific serine/threonine protein kinase n=1 Tax=Uabimicrobium amorphum TaxID=2596890 RepID=A0A5S9INA0_UABAM|nr:WD40 repeat domain-containing serine/threonine protein kinase [Candidatus Uabimicrobium amorphum]BBM84657.1 protein kinase [Candidatus Uabimicrobium amorphum]